MNLRKSIQKCSKGDRSAQNELYAHVYRELLHIPLRYMSSREDAMAVFNQGMHKVFQNIEKVDNANNPMGLIATIIKRTTIDHLRMMTNFRKKHLSVGDYNIEVEEISTNELLDDLDVEHIFQIIQSLPQAERTVFSLYEIEGYKHKEIADLLSITDGHSKYLLHHAKRKLRDMLSQYSNQHKTAKDGL